MISYSTRKNAFTGTQTFVLQGDKLEIIEDQAASRSIPLAEICRVRLEFNPTRFEPNRYCCKLMTRQNGECEFFNRSYAGVAEFRDSSPEYVQFVREVHSAIARTNPSCRFMSGCSEGRYWLNVAAMLFAALMLLGVLVFFVTVGMHWIALLKLLLIAAFSPVAIQWFRRNKRRVYEPTAIPNDVIPQPPAVRMPGFGNSAPRSATNSSHPE